MITPSRADVPDPLVGKVVAERFRILDLVARGGMGKIYKAEQLPLGRMIALKVLSPSDRQDTEEDAFRRRFEREASICAKLTHSNTVRIFDYGWTADGIYYIAMEWIEGLTLHQVVKAESPLPGLRVIHVARQIAVSLSEAHKLGIVHRDLKPSNVLLCTQGEDADFVKVVDFGLVKHVADNDVTQAGLIVGSPMYMSPEQVRGQDVDNRTDVYALGMIMYVALTGKRPFERETALQVLMARVNSKPPTFAEIAPGVEVPEALEWTVMTALATDRRERFESMYELLRALKVAEAEALGDHPGPFIMQLDNGRTVLPPEFSDQSIVSRSRAAVVPDGSSRGELAVALVALLAMGLASVVALVAIVSIARGTLNPAFAPVDSVLTPAAAPLPTPVPAVVEPVVTPIAPVEEPPAVPTPVDPPAAAIPVDPPPPQPTRPPKTKVAPPPSAEKPDPAKPPEDQWNAHASDIKNPFQ